MRRLVAGALALSILAPFAAAAESHTEGPRMTAVTLPSPDSPLVALRLVFRVGSIHDPNGKEGLAALTGLMVGAAGTGERSYGELVDALYPLASSISVRTDRELTVLSGVVHREKLDEFTALMTEALLRPGFAESDFTRNREQLLAYLTDTLRASSDELLGLEAIQQRVFSGHPYGHAPQGTVAGLEAITLDDVRGFYRERFTQAALTVGAAGAYPRGYVAALTKTLSALPPGKAGTGEPLPAPRLPGGRVLTMIAKKTDSVGVHVGFPLAVTRADADHYPLMIANSFLGEHRTFHGRLMKQLRGKRGLNYGDYSYIEYWDNPPGTSKPSANVPRRQQYFSIWVRPVVPANAHFALRGALHELDRLIETGMTEEEFELTREFVVNYSKLWVQTLDNRLGFLIDSAFYGTEPYVERIERELAKLTVGDVNAAVRKHLQSERFEAVLVGDDVAGLAAGILAETPGSPDYNTPPEPDVIEADKTIRELPIEADEIRIVPADRMFAR